LSYPSSNPNEFFPYEVYYGSELPWPVASIAPKLDDIISQVVNIPSRVWGFFEDKFRDALEWLSNQFAVPLITYAFDVWSITDEWTRGWPEPWKIISRLFMFPAAFVYKGLRDYVGPTVANAVKEIKEYLDGALGPIADTISNIFKPLVDPVKNFVDKFVKFVAEDLLEFFRNAYDFFTSLPAKIVDIYNWLKDSFGKGWEGLVEFFTKTLPDWLNSINDFITNLPERVKKFFTEDLPSWIGPIMKSAYDFLNEKIGKPLVDSIRNVWSTVEDSARSFIRSVLEFYYGLVEDYSRGGFEAVLTRMLPLVATGLSIATAVDIASLKIAGTGVDLNAVREFINNTVMKFFDISIFTSVFFAIAVQKPLEYVVKRAFRTERPNPGDAMSWYAKNIIDSEEALEYLRIAGYPDEIAQKYLRSIYKEPDFLSVFTAYKRGRIDEREYRTWLSVLNVDKAELLDGTYYPYKVLEEAAYRVPSPFMLTYAVETGEVSEEVLKKILEYDLIHPDFIEPLVKALLWRAARDDRSLLRRYLVDLFTEGILKVDEFEHYLGVLGISPDFARSIIEVADLNRRKNIRRKALSYLEKQFLEGYMSRDEFVNQLVSYGFDEELVREYASLLQYVRDNYIVIKETKDERNSLKSSLVSKFKAGYISEEELESELRKLGLNDVEIALTIARAKLEFDAEQKEILFKDLIEKLRQGWISKSEFTDSCQRLGIRYERCLAYADYYWTKYIGENFYVITKDERSALATSLVKKYINGFMSEEELRTELKKLMFTDEEIDLRIKRAMVEDEIKLLSDALAEADALLKRGEITFEEYVEYLVSLGMRRDRAELRGRKILASTMKKK
jgi:hypothetical protein